jgi:hypothetical protein
MNRFAITMAAVALALTACGKQGPGVGAQSEAQQSANDTAGLDRSKSLEQSKSVKASVSLPVLPVLAEAWRHWAFDGQVPPAVLREGCEPFFGADATSDVRSRRAAAVRLQYAQDLAAAELACARSFTYQVAFGSHRAWPAEPDTRDAERWTVQAMGAVLAVTDIAGQVVPELVVRPQRDLQTVQEQALGLLKDREPQLVGLLRKRIAESSTLELAIPPDGGQPVAFSRGSYALDLTPKGASLSFAGTTWLGDGKVQGKAFEVALDSSSTATLAKKSDNATRSETSTVNRTSASVDVGK